MATTPKEEFQLHNKRIKILLDNFQKEQQDMIYTSMSLGKQLESVANILNVHIPNHMNQNEYYTRDQRMPHFRDVYSFSISKKYESMHEIIADLRAEVKAMRKLFFDAIGEHDELKAIMRDETPVQDEDDEFDEDD